MGDVSPGSGQRERVAERYRRFATVEARGHAPLYEALCLAIAEDETILSFLSGLPDRQAQPNLFLAILRFCFGPLQDIAALRTIVTTRADALRTALSARTTQTNEPARCAVLLPYLARLPQPLALLEVGASAGLCLLPDRYSYRYGPHRLRSTFEGGGDSPEFSCPVSGSVPIPPALPRIVWRAGLDLNPLDVAAPADMAWLEALVWPGQDDRLARLRMAAELARKDPPTIHRGDLCRDLPALLEMAPASATRVVFHTAVLAYLPHDARLDFTALMAGTEAIWISNEAPGVLPDLADGVPSAPCPDGFVLAVNGVATAWSGPHGQWLHGIA